MNELLSMSGDMFSAPQVQQPANTFKPMAMPTTPVTPAQNQAAPVPQTGDPFKNIMAGYGQAP
jgi:hypothetical protein